MGLQAVFSAVKSPLVWGTALLATTALAGMYLIRKYRARNQPVVAPPDLFNLPVDALVSGFSDWDGKVGQFEQQVAQQQPRRSWLSWMFSRSDESLRGGGVKRE